jgi:amino acid transporter
MNAQDEQQNLNPPSKPLLRRSLENWFIGHPLATADAAHQTIGKLVGLAVFSSDALSSVAYATQEMMVILVAAGTVAFGYSLPLVFAIIGLLAILTFSYRQTIHAYPDGGGAYIVARDNLGELPAQVASGALLTDYALTVAVSISSGVAQLVSAYPPLLHYSVWIAVGMVFFIMMINLRGVKEAGITFAIPSYYFLIMMYLTVFVGLFRYFTGSLGMVQGLPPIEVLNGLQPITFFLILKAFSNGTSALTGVEAISNGITAFKEPRSKNAAQTLVWMAFILGSLLLGITFLTHQIGSIPSEHETIISQLGRTVFGGRGILYLAMIIATTVILMMAANTAFAGFPRLSAIQAADGFLPRQLTLRGSRLVYSRGIIALAVIASILVIVFQASVTRLIPLYAIGVFLSFTLSQFGMARRWWKSGHLKPGVEVQEHGSILSHDKQWVLKMVINGFGSICTAVVAVVFAITKFHDGAYIVIIFIPILVLIFFAINHHYRGLARQLSLEQGYPQHKIQRNRIIIPISGVHKGTLDALRFATTLSDDITAVYVAIEPKDVIKIQQKWDIWGEDTRLVILDSPYRTLVEPLLDYILKIKQSMNANEIVTVVVPQFVPRRRWSGFLHMRTAETLRQIFLQRDDIVIVEVPYQVS